MRKLAATLVAMGLITLVPTAEAKKPKPITGSVDVQAVPFPGAWVVVEGRFGCLLGEEGVSHVSIPFEAPFSGNFTASVSEFEGDWDIYLMDEAGSILAADNTGVSNAEISVPDTFSYQLAADQKVSIVVCNYVGSPTAQVDYKLVYAKPPKVPTSPAFRRTDVMTYDVPGAVFTTPTDVYVHCNWGPEPATSCRPLEFSPFDRALSVEIEDDVAEVVGAVVYQWGNRGEYTRHVVCGKTDDPIPVLKGATGGEVDVAVGLCGDGAASTPTSGTITVTYSNR